MLKYWIYWTLKTNRSLFHKFRLILHVMLWSKLALLIMHSDWNDNISSSISRRTAFLFWKYRSSWPKSDNTTSSICKLFDRTASLGPSESQIWQTDKLAPFYTDSKKSLHPALLPDKAFKSSWLRVNAEWHSTSFLLFQNELMDDLWDGNTQTSGQRLGNSFSVGPFLLIKIISSRERERKRGSTALKKK